MSLNTQELPRTVSVEKNWNNVIKQFWLSSLFAWTIIAVGIILRLAQYLFNRSLWLDESFLALNITNRSLSGLAKPLDYDQGAPFGFLALDKLVTLVIGNSEYALRLVPFLAGIISLLLFYQVAKLCLKPINIPIALGLFAFSDTLIYFSSELKPYSLDVTVALAIYVVAFAVVSRKMTVQSSLVLGVVGAVGIWFSFPSLFVLAGVGVTLFGFSLIKRDWPRLGWVLLVFLLWLVSFAIFYVVSLGAQSSSQVLHNLWLDHFMPLPFSINGMVWLIVHFKGLLVVPGPEIFFWLSIPLFLIGSVAMFRTRSQYFLALVLPIFITLLASSLGRYPFFGRLLLFLVPAVLLLVSTGVEQVRESLPVLLKLMPKAKNNVIAISNWSYLGLVVVLFINPIVTDMLHLVSPRTQEEIRPVLSYLQQHIQTNDAVYISSIAQYPFKYYQREFNLTGSCCVIGTASETDQPGFINDVSKLKGNKRVWLLFTRFDPSNGRKFILNYLDSNGKKLDETVSPGAIYLFLYDLSQA